MTSIDVLDVAGKKSGSVELPEALFGVQVNIPLIHQVVVAQQAAARQGTHKTKARGEVRGGGVKPYRQKGTGRARQGSIRAPQFAGGGVVHGPTPRDYSQRTPKKMKAAALRGALSDRAAHGRVHVVQALVEGDAPSTKTARIALEKITSAARVLLVVTQGDELTAISARNLPQVHLLTVDQLNTLDVMVNDDVVFSAAALEEFVSGGRRSATAAASSSELGEDDK
ncbi:MAG: 50S ribosomal protein L4 [Corynebacteriales bacterium]|nr:50S ribosomal protein L4 [Mycobacteriales bacterium]